MQLVQHSALNFTLRLTFFLSHSKFCCRHIIISLLTTSHNSPRLSLTQDSAVNSLPLCLCPLLHCFVLKVFMVIPYTIILLVVRFTKSLNCSLPFHITFAPLSSCDTTMHAFLTPPSHLVQSLSLTLLLSPSKLYSPYFHNY